MHTNSGTRKQMKQQEASGAPRDNTGHQLTVQEKGVEEDEVGRVGEPPHTLALTHSRTQRRKGATATWEVA